MGRLLSSRFSMSTHRLGMKESKGKTFLAFSSVLILGITTVSLLFGAIVSQRSKLFVRKDEIFESLSSQTQKRTQISLRVKDFKRISWMPTLAFYMFERSIVMIEIAFNVFRKLFFNHGKEGGTCLLREDKRFLFLWTHFLSRLYTWTHIRSNILKKDFGMMLSFETV